MLDVAEVDELVLEFVDGVPRKAAGARREIEGGEGGGDHGIAQVHIFKDFIAGVRSDVGVIAAGTFGQIDRGLAVLGPGHERGFIGREVQVGEVQRVIRGTPERRGAVGRVGPEGIGTLLDGEAKSLERGVILRGQGGDDVHGGRLGGGA